MAEYLDSSARKWSIPECRDGRACNQLLLLPSVVVRSVIENTYHATAVSHPKEIATLSFETVKQSYGIGTHNRSNSDENSNLREMANESDVP